MKSLLSSAACIGLLLTGAPLGAQVMHDNTAREMTCDNGGNNGRQARHCEIREMNLPSIGRLNVDASPNGGVTVKGWLQGGVLVRARIETYGDTDSEAAMLASRVLVDGSGGQVRASGPDGANRHSGWSVGYEIFVPQTSDLVLKTVNGGVHVSDINGQLQLNTINGGVHLERVAGDITGETVNGGIHAELAGPNFAGRQLNLTTQNGGVHVALPASYSAHVQAETGMGRIHSDFPMSMSGNLVNGDTRPQRLEFDLGGGGAPIHIHTQNGGVTIQKTQ